MIDQFLDKKIAEYTESFTTEEPKIVKDLIRESDQYLEFTDMHCGRQVGMMLKMLIAISNAKCVLEIGTFIGYSALMIAESLPDDGELFTCEYNQKYFDISEKYFSRSPYHQKIHQIRGDALETIPNLEAVFDLVFLDADKINYPEYYRLIKDKVRSGSILVVDNTLWGGKVLEANTPKAEAIDKMNSMIQEDPNIEQVMLPVRDGLLIARFQ